jgi:hypothetical protein
VRIVRQLGHEQFFPNSFQFIVHHAIQFSSILLVFLFIRTHVLEKQKYTSSIHQHNNKIYVDIVLFPLHVLIPIGSSSGGHLINLKLKTTVTEFAKLSGWSITISIKYLSVS